MNTTKQNIFNNKLFFALFITEGVIVIPTVLGNVLLIYCIKRYRTLHARSYILIANLAVSDLLLGLIFIPYDMTSFGFPEMHEHKITCLLRNVLLLEFVGASVLNLLVISLERYAAVVYPLWHLKLSQKWLIGSIAAAWIVSTIIAILLLLGWNTWDSTLKCTYRWNDTMPQSYKTLWLSIYLTSVVISCILFIRVVIISFKLLNASANHESESNILKFSQRSLKFSVEKTKIFILILGIFVLCWAPYCTIVVLQTFIQRENKKFVEAKFYCGLLAFLNSSLNWIIYGLKNRNIRRAFKPTLCKWKLRIEGITQQYSNQESFTELRPVHSLNLHTL